MSLRLAQLALQHWESIDGLAASQNMPDLRTLSQDRFDNFIWWWFTRNASEQVEIDKFKSELWRPPPGTKVTHRNSPWSPENETSALADLKASLGG